MADAQFKTPQKPYSNGKLAFLFAGPIAGIFACIIAFAIVSFIVNASTGMQGGIFQTVMDTLIFLLGAVSVIALPIGIIFGVIGLKKNQQFVQDDADGVESVKKTAENTLEASKGWNWGAFFLTWVWGVANGVPKALWALVPLWGIVYAFILGAKGNQWAWEGGNWESIEQFRATQKRWAIWGAIIFAVLVILYIFSGQNQS
jgi:hypothetical protein